MKLISGLTPIARIQEQKHTDEQKIVMYTQKT